MGRTKLSDLKSLSKEEKAMIEKAAGQKIVYDEDCPKTTPEMLEEFKKAAEARRDSRRKNVLSLRVSASTMEKAKALGSGYSGILSRMLDMCLDNPEIIKKCL